MEKSQFFILSLVWKKFSVWVGSWCGMFGEFDEVFRYFRRGVELNGLGQEWLVFL